MNFRFLASAARQGLRESRLGYWRVWPKWFSPFERPAVNVRWARLVLTLYFDTRDQEVLATVSRAVLGCRIRGRRVGLGYWLEAVGVVPAVESRIRQSTQLAAVVRQTDEVLRSMRSTRLLTKTVREASRLQRKGTIARGQQLNNVPQAISDGLSDTQISRTPPS